MENNQLIQEINKHLSVFLPDKISIPELEIQLSILVNHLIQTDFQRLIMLLYRIDVSEPKLKKLLKQHPREEAGKIIAGLIIERQIQKIKTRQQFSQQNESFTEEEKW